MEFSAPYLEDKARVGPSLRNRCQRTAACTRPGVKLSWLSAESLTTRGAAMVPGVNVSDARGVDVGTGVVAGTGLVPVVGPPLGAGEVAPLDCPGSNVEPGRDAAELQAVTSNVAVASQATRRRVGNAASCMVGFLP